MSNDIWVNRDGAEANKIKFEDSTGKAEIAKKMIRFVPYYQTDRKWTRVVEVQHFRAAYREKIEALKSDIDATQKKIEKFKDAYDAAVVALTNTDKVAATDITRRQASIDQLNGVMNAILPPPPDED